MKIAIDRRDFARFVGGGAALALLAKCAPGSGGIDVDQVASAFLDISSNIVLVEPQFAALTNPTTGQPAIPAPTLSSILGYDNQIAAAANAITAANAAAQGQSTLTQIELYANALAPIVEPYVAMAANAAAPGSGIIVALVFAALPEIELLLNVTVSELTPIVKQIAAQAPAPLAAAPRALLPGAVPTPYLDELHRRRIGK
jgi:hypothetical protein